VDGIRRTRCDTSIDTSLEIGGRMTWETFVLKVNDLFSRKFIFAEQSFIAAVVLCATGKMTGTEFVAAIVAIQVIYTAGNVIEGK
jgi:hypothetical protein